MRTLLVTKEGCVYDCFDTVLPTISAHSYRLVRGMGGRDSEDKSMQGPGLFSFGEAAHQIRSVFIIPEDMPLNEALEKICQKIN